MSFKSKEEFAIAIMKQPWWDDEGNKVFFNADFTEPFRVLCHNEESCEPMKDIWDWFNGEWFTHPPLQHNQPVLCWNNGWNCGAEIRFWDNNKGSTYGQPQEGYDNVIPYTGELPEHMKEYLKKLEEEKS
jgi:hypothetical protein